MLTLTENASTIVQTLVSQVSQASEDETTDAAGLRFSHDGQSIGVTPVQAPVAGDQVVEDGGATVYLEEAAAAALSDQVLDASVDEAGAVQFSITPAAPPGA